MNVCPHSPSKWWWLAVWIALSGQGLFYHAVMPLFITDNMHLESLLDYKTAALNKAHKIKE